MILGLILFAVFLALSLLHISWALGNSRGFKSSIPTNENGVPVLNPKKIDSLIVGIGLLLFGVFYLIKSGIVEFDIPTWAYNIFSWMIPILFLLRATGDFKYVGFFKKVKSTDFGKMDSKFYSPLCLAISLIGFIIHFTI